MINEILVKNNLEGHFEVHFFEFEIYCELRLLSRYMYRKLIRYFWRYLILLYENLVTTVVGTVRR